MQSEETPHVIQAEVRFDERDFVTAHREVAPLRRAMVISSSVTLLIILASGACLLKALSELPLVGFAPLFMIVVGSLWLWKVRTRGSREFRSMSEWQTRVRYRFSSTGLRIETEKESSEQSWDRFASWSEGESAFYVEQVGQRFQIIPKRAFDDQDAADAVRSLLRENVRSRPELRGPRVQRNRLLISIGLWLVLVTMFVVIYQLVTSGTTPPDLPEDEAHQPAD